MNNPEDANELNIYKRLTDIERRLDLLYEKHKKLQEDYQFNRGGRRKTRKKKRSRKKKNRRKRRKTRRKSAGYTPDFYKKSVEQPLE
mgnify:CR=1 FL=1|tara:strand:- start:125 stop:385 length:261 start_codon:yes stop_codon:yes gene_type:complete